MNYPVSTLYRQWSPRWFYVSAIIGCVRTCANQHPGVQSQPLAYSRNPNCWINWVTPFARWVSATEPKEFLLDGLRRSSLFAGDIMLQRWPS
jgi:hypothetical protein